jgi:hypothetical protein
MLGMTLGIRASEGDDQGMVVYKVRAKLKRLRKLFGLPSLEDQVLKLRVGRVYRQSEASPVKFVHGWRDDEWWEQNKNKPG